MYKRSDFSMTPSAMWPGEWYVSHYADGCYLHTDGQLKPSCGDGSVKHPNRTAADKALDAFLLKANSGVELIAAERERQIQKGFTAEHDDFTFYSGRLADAAACYAVYAANHSDDGSCPADGDSILYWPQMTSMEWKPGTDRVKQLAKAGALIAAEIDRLQLAEVREAQEKRDAERKAQEKPRPFKYSSGYGVFFPSSGEYKYVRLDGGNGIANSNVFIGLEWLAA